MKQHWEIEEKIFYDSILCSWMRSSHCKMKRTRTCFKAQSKVIYAVFGLVDKETLCNDMDSVVSELRVELNAAKEKLALQETDITMLKNELEETKKESHVELNQAQNTILSQAKDIEMLKDAVAEATRRGEELAVQNRQAQKHVQKLQSCKDKATNSVRDLKVELQDRENELENEAKCRSKLHTDCLFLRADNCWLEEQNTGLHSEIDQLNLHLQTVTSQNDSLTQRLEEQSIAPFGHLSDLICKTTDREELTRVQNDINEFKKTVDRRIVECCDVQAATMSQRVQDAEAAQLQAEIKNKEYEQMLTESKKELEQLKALTEKQCSICLTPNPDYMMDPCAHICLCAECAKNPQFNGEEGRCPICRELGNPKKVYLP